MTAGWGTLHSTRAYGPPFDYYEWIPDLKTWGTPGTFFQARTLSPRSQALVDARMGSTWVRTPGLSWALVVQ